MKHTRIKELLKTEEFGKEVIVKGWVRTFRNNQFIAINDGSSINNIQAVVDFENTDEALLKRITTGAAVQVKGQLVESLGKGQRVEIKVNELTILGDSDPEKYPLQPKKHSLEFLREIAHLRFRTGTFSAIFKIRNALAFAVHTFFNERDFVYMHTPIITGSDAEGAGEMFQVTTLDLNNPPRTDSGEIDFKEDFFGKPTNLTVSGQLEGELAAMALGNIYTFGPTFRAENSNTTRHLAEFWMIEPEMAFYELDDNMDLAEDLLKYVIKYALDTCPEEIELLNNRVLEEEKSKPQNQRSEMSLIEKLNFVIENDFERVTYTEAIEILKRSKPNQKKQFKYLIEEWGADLQSEHERYLVEKHYKKPVILTDYPREIKSFYMKQNEPDAHGRHTVRAMDILFPGIGEMVGGSQREENLDKLLTRMAEVGIPEEEMDWFLDTRRFGSAPHSGFGVGFERLVLFVTGMTNIRDVIPFPRTPKNAEF
ncbi:asparagine--tRNA ligase [Sphingobacterium corticibacterium]|uniref:Asparagine--tRNA ligase n=1 Tax=Sphingobacterium corticibacterium TaxID=2484746 RepID=A0A4Q6XUY1_9SPHI|nr:asparagine--tRNA ligase [Sphingobacterium corticibacterium]RZF60447.1 asparagine--tRNA ligase [Sphingobacterium corticibacterium]